MIQDKLRFTKSQKS